MAITEIKQAFLQVGVDTDINLYRLVNLSETIQSLKG